MGHDDLADYLAAWLRGQSSRMTWTNFRMDNWGTARPDVFSIVKTTNLRKCIPIVHEIKVSRSDFQSDVRTGKWEKYKPVCQGVYFVCPVGMVDKSEVPSEAGLMVFDHAAQFRYNSFSIVKRPKTNRNWVFDDCFTMRLLMGRWGSEPSLLAKKMHQFKIGPVATSTTMEK
jgi:DNA repair protein MmcB-like